MIPMKIMKKFTAETEKLIDEICDLITGKDKNVVGCALQSVLLGFIDSYEVPCERNEIIDHIIASLLRKKIYQIAG